MRYQTSSMRKNAKPTTAAAARTNRGGAASGRSRAAPSPGESGTGEDRRLSAPARRATPRFATAASQRVQRVPNASRSQNVAARQPATAPSVFTP